MQPLGRRPIRFPGKEDSHPGKGYKNWWEDNDGDNKSTEKRQAKKEIQIELNNIENNS